MEEAMETEASSSAVQADPPTAAATEFLVPKHTYREIEQNSSTIFELAGPSDSVIGQLSLNCNELIREICQRQVDKSTIDKLTFWLRDERPSEKEAEPLVLLAKSIRAMAMAMGGFEDVSARRLTLDSLEIDGLNNSLPGPSQPPKKKKKRNPNALFRSLSDSDNEVKYVPSDGVMPVSAVNDYIAPRLAVFRPITPEGMERQGSTPPPPGPFRLRSHDESSSEDESWNSDEDSPPPPKVKKVPIRCDVCNARFSKKGELTMHIAAHHRSNADGEGNKGKGGSARKAKARPSAIVTTRPITGFQSISNGPNNQQLLSSKSVTAPDGTVRVYSSASNAARAAAKTAAAAAAGVVRPIMPSKPYTCRQCGVVLASQQMYASHVRYSHPKEKDDNSPAVRKSSSGYTSSSIVHVHEDGTKSFECRRCEKIFDSSQKVAGHSKHCLLVFEGKARPMNQGPIPTEDRPYTVYRTGLNSELAKTCPYCLEMFGSIRQVDKHVRVDHEAIRCEVYGCSTCNRRFVTLGGIENHWLHYGDCPNGRLSVHHNGVDMMADIMECPPELIPQSTKVVEEEEEEEEDPSIRIVNTILGQYGYKVNNGGAVKAKPRSNGRTTMTDTESDGNLEDAATIDVTDTSNILNNIYGAIHGKPIARMHADGSIEGGSAATAEYERIYRRVSATNGSMKHANDAHNMQ